MLQLLYWTKWIVMAMKVCLQRNYCKWLHVHLIFLLDICHAIVMSFIAVYLLLCLVGTPSLCTADEKKSDETSDSDHGILYTSQHYVLDTLKEFGSICSQVNMEMPYVSKTTLVWSQVLAFVSLLIYTKCLSFPLTFSSHTRSYFNIIVPYTDWSFIHTYRTSWRLFPCWIHGEKVIWVQWQIYLQKRSSSGRYCLLQSLWWHWPHAWSARTIDLITYLTLSYFPWKSPPSWVSLRQHLQQ